MATDWLQVDKMLEAALEVERARRKSFLVEKCAGDEPLRREVESLLAAHDQAGSFLESPPADFAADALGADALAPIALGAIALDAMIHRLAAGQTIGRYKILRELGRGGMGEVYLAADAELGRNVALKLLPAFFGRDEELVRRFKQEARAASALNHPNIITIHEVACVDDLQFIVTEFVDGETLAAILARGPLPIEQCLTIARQLADALAEAHSAGIIHRDIKPQNIMLNGRGQVKVLDFGLAKVAERALTGGTEVAATTGPLSEPGLIVGTIAYMSPEQLRGEAVDLRTDIFSLGSTLYEMIAGEQPFASDSSAETIAAILTREPPLLRERSAQIPEELGQVVDRCLQKDRDRRYRTMLEPAAELERLCLRSAQTAGEASQATPVDGQRNSSKADRRPAGRRILPRRRLMIAVALAIAILGAAGYEWLSHRKAVPASSILAEVPTSAITSSVAVLPFKPLSEEGREEYIELGLADAVIERLGSLRGVVVRPISAVRKYTDLQQDPLAAGRELKVEAVLDANIQRAGDRVRVTARLLRVKDGGLLWAERYDENFKDVLTLEDAISGRVASALTSVLTGEERKRLAKHYTDNADAYRAYLLGRYYWNKRTTNEALYRAIQYFQQAVNIEPDYALAYAGLADCYISLDNRLFKPSADPVPQAKAAAVKALELDDGLAEAHTSWAYILFLYEHDWAGAETQFSRAIQLNPNYATAHQWYSWCLATSGRLAEGRSELRRAQEIDPLSPLINTNIGTGFYYSRDYDRAIDQIKKTLDTEPDFEHAYWELGNAYERKHMYQQTVEAYQRALELSGKKRIADEVGDIYRLSGFGAAMRKLVDYWKGQVSGLEGNTYAIAKVLAMLGDTDGAFEWLEKAYEGRHPWLIQLKIDPALDSLRSDPRFTDLLRRMGIPQS